MLVKVAKSQPLIKKVALWFIGKLGTKIEYGILLVSASLFFAVLHFLAYVSLSLPPGYDKEIGSQSGCGYLPYVNVESAESSSHVCSYTALTCHFFAIFLSK